MPLRQTTLPTEEKSISRLVNRALRVVAGIRIAAVLTIGGLLGWSVLSLALRPSTPLTMALPRDWQAARSEFDRRIKARFPLGSSARGMVAELQRQGFTRPTWDTPVTQEHQATRTKSTFVCIIVAEVGWRTNSDGRLMAVKGVYGEQGCL